MKRFILLLSLTLIFAVSSQGQGFSHFWSPRPALPAAYRLGGSGLFEMKPSLMISGSMFRKSELGGIQTSFLNAAGFGLSYIHSNQDISGVNSSDYAFTLGFLLTGNSDLAPTFQPSVVLTAGLFNNMIQFGPGYEISTARPVSQRFFVVISFGILPTLN